MIFPGISLNLKKNKAVGEITPSYLYVPECPKLIQESLGSKIKFIVS
jgi:hypothetical protein